MPLVDTVIDNWLRVCAVSDRAVAWRLGSPTEKKKIPQMSRKNCGHILTSWQRSHDTRVTMCCRSQITIYYIHSFRLCPALELGLAPVGCRKQCVELRLELRGERGLGEMIDSKQNKLQVYIIKGEAG